MTKIERWGLDSLDREREKILFIPMFKVGAYSQDTSLCSANAYLSLAPASDFKLLLIQV